ncbi:MAG: translation elongation factor 4, partial [Patescibacteria group bacterium]
IDTPGHIDFYYEVSRALKAVEGSILLVDATQGVQAQTLSTLQATRAAGLVIIPVLSKIDAPLARRDEVKQEIIKLLDCSMEDIVETSGKTGEGVETLLGEIIRRVPPPKMPANAPEKSAEKFRSLIFDFQYSNHTGVIVFIRVVSGSVKRNDDLVFKIAEKTFRAIDVGIFAPDETPVAELGPGEIGYIVTGVKEPGVASVGDTIASPSDTSPPLSGYEIPNSVVWSSLFPKSQDDIPFLRQALSKLKLSDSSLTFEEESSNILGKGFRCGFLGMLHLEIITERLKREFGMDLVVTTPSIHYEVVLKNGERQTCYSPAAFPEEHLIATVEEPWVKLSVITPSLYVGPISQLIFEHAGIMGDTISFGENRLSISAEMPLRELMRNFFNKLKSISSGFASLSYEIVGFQKADVSLLEVLVAEEAVPAFARIVARSSVEREAVDVVDRLYKALPRQMFATKIQAKGLGRIIASQTLPALKKNVTAHMYGGDRTRKMKLWEKQKEGKKRMKEQGTVNIPQDVFMKMVQGE